MKTTMVLMSSNRELEPQTKETCRELQQAGAMRLVETGSTDVALARNRALSFACEKLREYPERDVVLMLDDDMAVPLDTAERVVSVARELGVATSAIYATKGSKLAGCRWAEKPGRWLVGLGCVAVPSRLLLELEERSDSFEFAGHFFSQFTWSAAEQGQWIGEDYRLCRRLGGVLLLPVAVGHVKKGELWPDDETIAEVKRLNEEAHS